MIVTIPEIGYCFPNKLQLNPKPARAFSRLRKLKMIKAIRKDDES